LITINIYHIKKITQILIASLFLLVPLTLKSTHIVGGTFTYEVLEIANDVATLEVSLYVYLDNNGGADFDQNLELALFKYDNSAYEYVSRKFVNISSFKTLELNDLMDCSPFILNYELGVYTTQIDVPLNNYEHFTFAYQRCCRDNSISNIKIPEETGIAISFDLFPKAFTMLNQSIVVNNLLPLLNTVSVSTTFDLSVEDDSDKLYYLSTPKAAGGVLGTAFGDPTDCEGITPNPQNCLPNFPEVEYVDLDNPYGTGATLAIDSDSGMLNINIPEIGKILVGVTIDRYSEDELFCRIRQQFLMNTMDCAIASTKDNIVSDLEIWPVPSNGFLYFENQLQNITILNTNGVSQQFQAQSKLSNQIDLKHISNGVYIIKGQTSEGSWIAKKIVIMK
jgi:hypothetical protein